MCPGCISVAIAIGTRWRRSASTGGALFFAQEVEGAGEQHRDGAGACHRRDALLVGVFEMIGRQCAVTGRRAPRRAVFDSWSACSLTGKPAACAPP